ncbi:MAG: NAD(P)-binding protein [Rhodospirillaceae bacterium]|jgi:3-hydroxybenzoate 6-monooxygenase|nr:NAD(P)-binding protein [Rhodospirillaceae bacterium]
MASNDPILIVGGGFGGLTAALALGQRGIPVHVFEGAPEFGAIGYGIQFGPNIFHVFDALGISDEVKAVGDEPPGLLMLDALNGDQVINIPTGESFRNRFTHQYLIIHRIDLHNVLLDACRKIDAITLEPEAKMSSYEDHGDQVSIKLEDGRSFTGRALIGADGIGSTTRAQMIGDGDPLPNGYVAHRTIVPMETVTADVPRDVVVLWGGPGFHIVHYPLRHNALFNIVAVFRSDNQAQRGDVDAYRTELMETHASTHPEAKTLIEMMDLERRFIIGDRDPIRHWHQGRVGLLGDAAHPTLQSLAQGAGMAIEDGLHLANLIVANEDDFDTTFTQFTKDRYLRCARVTLESRYIWEFYHGEGIEREVQYQINKDRNEADPYECISWLYDGFPFSS